MQHLLRPRQRRPRQQATICYLLSTLALVASSAAYTIGDSDPSVVYVPSDLANDLCVSNPTTPECANRWWAESIAGTYLGKVKTTNGPNASLRVSFQGARIQVFGVTDRRGATARVSMDGGAFQTVITRAGDRSQHIRVPLYTVGSLDPKVTHNLTIEYDAINTGGNSEKPHLLRIDYFEVDDGSVGFPPQVPSSTAGGATINSAPEPLPNTPVTNSPNGVSSPTQSVANGTDSTDKSSSSSSTIPIVAGLSTGVATLAIASAVIFFLLRRRRAVRIESMQLPRSTPPQMSTRGDHSNSRGMANLAYAFNRRGSSVASSADAPAPGPPPTQPLPPVPPLNTYVSPYTYQRHGRPYPRSVDSYSSIGLPVDERPPNIPQARSPISPVAGSGRVLRVYNPDGSTVVSSSQGH